MTTTEDSVDIASFRPQELEIDGDGGGHLLGSRCTACGAHYFPVRPVCAGCLSDELEPVRFSNEGTLYTYTVIHQSTPAFEVPYLLGYVDLPEGVRVMGQLTGTESDIRIGAPMRLRIESFGVDDTGTELLGYRFAPVDEEEDPT